MPTYDFSSEVIERFWPKVDKNTENGCWEWTAYKAKLRGTRYGIFRAGPLVKAHRYSWILTNGDIPLGLKVLHKCDNSSCVNPDHLFLGTQQENILDMINKGRSNFGGTKGSKQWQSKFLESQIVEIRKCYASGDTLKQIAKRYNCSFSTIASIVRRKTWKHVK